MDLDTVGAALRRKLGPLPVWIWAIFGGAVVYFLRQRGYFQGVLGGASQSGTTLQPSQASARDPQAQIPLQPGESVYDPNTGALSTAPGGDGPGTTGTDTGQAIEDLAEAIGAGQTTQPAPTPAPTAANPAKVKPAPKKPHKAPKPQGRPKSRKPGAKAGHKQDPKKTTKHSAPHPKPERPRSSVRVRTGNGGRTKPPAAKPAPGRSDHKGAPAPTPHTRVPTGPGKTTIRQRPTVPIVTHTGPVQHPVASHPTRGATTAPAPRPSAPPPAPGPRPKTAPAQRATPPAPRPHPAPPAPHPAPPPRRRR